MSFGGRYDSVSSSKIGSYGKFATAAYTDKTETGYKIKGVKTPVQVDADLYAKVKLLAAVGAENHTALIPAITSMTAPDSVTGISREVTKTELPTYKVINYDSTISEMKASENTPEISANPSDVRVSLTDQSEYGNYQINLEGLPEEIKTDKNVLGVTFEAGSSKKNAKVFGLSHVDNIIADGELAFSVEMGNYGGNLAHKRFASLPGDKIYKITYLLSDHKKFEIDGLELYIPKRLRSSHIPAIASKTEFSAENGADVTFDMRKMPYEGYEIGDLFFGSKDNAKNIVEGTDYTFDKTNKTLSIKSTENTGMGEYTVILKDANKKDGYCSTSFKFELGEAKEKEEGQDNIVKDVVENVTMFGYYASLRVTFNKKT